MALEDYPYAFNPVVVLNPTTGAPAANVTVQLRATPEGAALPVSDGQGNPITLTTTPLGVLPHHRTTVDMPYVYAGSAVTLREVAVELMNALPAAEAAQLAAETAAGIVEDWQPDTTIFVKKEDRSVAGGVAGLDEDGDVIDAAGQKVVGGGGLDEVTYANLPAGSMVTRLYDNGWAARGSARTDITFVWVDWTGEAPDPAGKLEGVDLIVTRREEA